MPRKPKGTAGGRYKRGPIPNPGIPQVGMIMNPSPPRQHNLFAGDPLGHQIGGFNRQSQDQFAELIRRYRKEQRKSGVKRPRKKAVSRQELEDWQTEGIKPKAKGKKMSKRKKNARRRRDSKGRFLPMGRKNNPKKKGKKKKAKKSYRKKGMSLVGRPRDSRGRLLPMRYKNPGSGAKSQRRLAKRRARDHKGRFLPMRYSNPNGDILRITTWSDAIEPAVAGLAGYATPGILDTLTRSWFTNKLAGLFKNMKGPEQKAQMTLSVMSFVGVWMATDKIKQLRPYRVPALIGSGARVILDLMDGLLPREKTGFSASLRQMFGLTGTFGTSANAAGAAGGAMKVGYNATTESIYNLENNQKVNVYIDKSGVARDVVSNRVLVDANGVKFQDAFELTPEDAMPRTQIEAQVYYQQMAGQDIPAASFATVSEARQAMQNLYATAAQIAEFDKKATNAEKIAYAKQIVAQLTPTSGFYRDVPTSGWHYAQAVGRGVPTRSYGAPTRGYRTPAVPPAGMSTVPMAKVGPQADSGYAFSNPFGNPFPNIS